MNDKESEVVSRLVAGVIRVAFLALTCFGILKLRDLLAGSDGKYSYFIAGIGFGCILMSAYVSYEKYKEIDKDINHVD
jgi:hypothetical protein